MQKKYLYLIAAAHFFNDINTGSLPAVLPFFVAAYQMDYKEVGGLMFASSFLSSIIQPIFGYLADRGSKDWFMSLGIVLAGVPLAFTGFTGDYTLIFGAITLMGIGSAVFHPEAARAVNALAGREKGAAMGIFSVGGNGGFGLGPLIAVFLITTFGMEGLAFYGIIGIVMGVLLMLAMPSLTKAIKAMKESETHSEESGEKVLEIHEAQNDWGAFSKLTLMIFFRSTLYSSISAFLPLYCINALGTTKAVGSSTLAVISIFGIIATMIGGRLADRWGYVRVIRLGCALMVPVLALMIFPQNLWCVYAMLIPFSLGMQGTYSSFVVLGQSYLAKNIGFASGITLGLSFSIGGIMTPILGSFGDANGIYAVMVLIFAIGVCCFLSTLILPEPKKTA